MRRVHDDVREGEGGEQVELGGQIVADTLE
jgi:hypothetical protein